MCILQNICEEFDTIGVQWEKIVIQCKAEEIKFRS